MFPPWCILQPNASHAKANHRKHCAVVYGHPFLRPALSVASGHTLSRVQNTHGESLAGVRSVRVDGDGVSMALARVDDRELPLPGVAADARGRGASSGGWRCTCECGIWLGVAQWELQAGVCACGPLIQTGSGWPFSVPQCAARLASAVADFFLYFLLKPDGYG